MNIIVGPELWQVGKINSGMGRPVEIVEGHRVDTTTSKI